MENILIVKNISIAEMIYLLSFIKLKTNSDVVDLNIFEGGKKILIMEHKTEEDKKEDDEGFQLKTMDDLDKLI